MSKKTDSKHRDVAYKKPLNESTQRMQRADIEFTSATVYLPNWVQK